MIHVFLIYCAVVGCALASFMFLFGVEDLDHPTEMSGAMNLTSLRSLSVGFGVFGLVGLFLEALGIPSLLVLPPAILLAFTAVLLLARAMRLLGMLDEDLSLQTYETLGESGIVYVPINPEIPGKVMVDVRGFSVEFSAVAPQYLPTGTPVVVTGYRDEGILEVSRKA